MLWTWAHQLHASQIAERQRSSGYAFMAATRPAVAASTGISRRRHHPPWPASAAAAATQRQAPAPLCTACSRISRQRRFHPAQRRGVPGPTSTQGAPALQLLPCNSICDSTGNHQPGGGYHRSAQLQWGTLQRGPQTPWQRHATQVEGHLGHGEQRMKGWLPALGPCAEVHALCVQAIAFILCNLDKVNMSVAGERGCVVEAVQHAVCMLTCAGWCSDPHGRGAGLESFRQGHRICSLLLGLHSHANTCRHTVDQVLLGGTV